MKLENMTKLMGKLVTECAGWLADGTKISEVKECLRGNLLAVFDPDLADAMVADIMEEAAKQALDILEQRSMEEPIDLTVIYDIVNR